MNPFSILINHMRFILFGGLMAGMAGMVHAQSPGGGQVGGTGTGGAPAGQLPSDIRSTSTDPRYPVDPRNAPIGQRNPYDGATAGQVSLDPRNTPIGQRNPYGGATAGQVPLDPRNTPIGQRDAYGGVAAGQLPSESRDAPAGQGNAYGRPTIGQSLPDSRNAPFGPSRTYGGAAAGQVPAVSGSTPTGQNRSYGYGTAWGQSPPASGNTSQRYSGQYPPTSENTSQRYTYGATPGKASIGKKRTYGATAPEQPPTGSGKAPAGQRDLQRGWAQPPASGSGNASLRERYPQGSADSGQRIPDKRDSVGDTSRRQEPISLGRERTIDPGPVRKAPETGGR